MFGIDFCDVRITEFESTCLSDFIKTIIYWRWRADQRIVFNTPLANICSFVFTIMSFYHIRGMGHAKYALVIHCWKGQE